MRKQTTGGEEEVKSDPHFYADLCLKMFFLLLQIFSQITVFAGWYLCRRTSPLEANPRSSMRKCAR